MRPANDFITARSWVDTCRTSHTICAKSNPNQSPPTKLINVGEDRVRVVPGKTCTGAYATLSHFWESMLIIQLTKTTEKLFGDVIK